MVLYLILGHQTSALGFIAGLEICLLGKESETEAWSPTMGQAGKGVHIWNSSLPFVCGPTGKPDWPF